MPYGSYERHFNLPFLAESSGAVYVARWTAFHVRQLTKSMTEALNKKGFTFVEVITPCPTLYERRNRLGDGLARMQWFKENSKIVHEADTRTVDINFQDPIICGKFVDIERQSYSDALNERFREELGDKYVPYEVPQ
jgi:2-oxoglutarate ferredoxin oxidoreductase subunit beta